jgi:5-methyltetrahydropteroyltriglutamate--homocysteine methyltransferase
MIDYFLRPMDGVSTDLTMDQLQHWRSKPGQRFRSAPPGIVTGPLGGGRLNLERDYLLFRDLTRLPRKFTITSPYMLAKTVGDEYYGDLEQLVMALADVLQKQVRGIDAEVVQVDEANITGHPEDARIAAAGINRVLEGVKGEKAVHLCYGNYGGQTIQKGTYDRLLAFLNLLQCDHLVLEMARRPEHELALLKDVRPEIGLGIGVIDIKDNEVESADVVAKRIERAATALGAERVQYVHPDCGFWMLPRSSSDAKMRSLVAGRDLFQGGPH